MPLSLRPYRLLPALALATLLPAAAWAAPFQDNNDGTVTDQATGLVWDRCAWGQSGADCSGGSASPLSWQAALQAAQTANGSAHKGHSDWRLPNVKELESLVQQLDAVSGPYIDAASFPNTPASGSAIAGWFWSSTSYAPDPTTYAWIIDFLSGYTATGTKTVPKPVRLVRSGQPLAFFDAFPDTTAPTITAGPTVTPGSDGTSASASVTVDEAGTGFWQVLPAAAAAPSAAALQGNGSSVSLTANTAASIAVANLTKGTAYQLHFLARDVAGNLSAVQSQPFTTADVPGAPTAVSAAPGAAGSGQVTVTWGAPATNGGSSITGYTVSPAGTGTACTASPCTITGLANASQYTFTVKAVNGVGAGASASSAALWLQDTQSITFANPGAQSIGGTLNLSASASSGLVVVFSASGVCSLSGSVLSFTSAGTCVVAANQVGDDAYAAAPQVSHSLAVNAAAPGAPASVSATPGNAQATVSWTAPASDGGSAITGYRAQVVGEAAKFCTAGASDTQCTVTGLSNGTAYHFQVSASNSVGAGTALPTSAGVTPQGTQSITFAALPDRALGAGGFALSASADSGLAVVFSSSTPAICTVAGNAVTLLAAGTCTIAATQPGDATWQAATAITRSFAIFTAPGAPTGVAATPGHAQATVSWTAPASDGGSAITGYRVQVQNDAARKCVASASATQCTVTGLSNGTAYAFVAYAVNAAGDSLPSGASASVTPQAPPQPQPDPQPQPEPEPEPPTTGNITVCPGGSLTGPGRATLCVGATLTVWPQAAGSPILPPTGGSATVVLGSTGGRVSLGLPAGAAGQAVVLAPAAGQTAPVLGLGSGSLLLGSAAPGQVLLDLGQPGAGSSASGRQATAGPQGGDIQAWREADGTLVVQVLTGSASLPCGLPCAGVPQPQPPTTLNLLAGERARMDAHGLAQQVQVRVPTAAPPATGALVPPAQMPLLAGAPPARTPHGSLLAQTHATLQTALQEALGPLSSQGQQPQGHAIWALGDVGTLGLLPLGLPQVDLTVADGLDFLANGALRVASGGLVQTFGPAPLGLDAALQALRTLAGPASPAVRLSVIEGGSWRIDGLGEAPLVARVGWLGVSGPPAPWLARFDVDEAGQLWLVRGTGLRAPIHAALAEPGDLLALLRAADARATLQVQPDGTAQATLGGQGYALTPRLVLQPAPADRAGQALWTEVEQGLLLLYVRLSDGWVQVLEVR